MKLQIYTDTIYTPHFRSSYHLRAADNRQFILFFLNSYRQLLIFSGRFWKYHQGPKKYHEITAITALFAYSRWNARARKAALFFGGADVIFTGKRQTYTLPYTSPATNLKIQIWYYYFSYLLSLSCWLSLKHKLQDIWYSINLL